MSYLSHVSEVARRVGVAGVLREDRTRHRFVIPRPQDRIHARRMSRGTGDYETVAFIDETCQHADAFLSGRTYEVFAGYWGSTGAGHPGVPHYLETAGDDPI